MHTPTDAKYVELHLHTAYSFLDGASQPIEIILRAKELGYRALAITDHDNLAGAMEFAQLAHGLGIQPITGAELTLLDGSHLTLLAENRQGYANLCQLITAAYHHDHDPTRTRRQGAPQPRLDPALLPDHAEGLILLTGCRQGQLSRLIDAEREDEATQLLRRYVKWFGVANVIVELQHNLVYGDTRRVARLVALARQQGLAYVATGDVHYHQRERHRLQDVLVAIRHHATLDTTHRERRPNSEFFLKSATEMARHFARYPAALKNTVKLAERCANFNLARDLDYKFPDYHLATGETADEHLAKICFAALPKRYDPKETVRYKNAKTRLEQELELIKHRELVGFFLLHHDLLELAREVANEIRAGTGRDNTRFPPGRGRGSSVSSIVCYLIGLAPVDPLAHNLEFGRFLNEYEKSIPDIDLDFPREIREQLIARIYKEYPDRAGLVCAFSTYKLRSAVRDIGKALGLPATDLDKIAKLSEPRSARQLRAELARMPEYASRLDVPPWSHLIDLAEQLAGFPRHITQHVGGMIISSSPIAEIVPIQPAAMPGRYLCQWDKDSCDDAGFVKIDFLALGMLSLVEECLDLIATRHPRQQPLDLSQINLADAAVYGMICRGDTIGTFQIESRAQIQMLPKTQPRQLEDLVVQVAIVRPGPIIGGAVSPYVLCRTQPNYKPVYDHPYLESVLKETLGVILYQEQVIQVAMKLAGFTAGQADALRRAMTRKRSHESMSKFDEQFMQGAAAKGVESDVAKRVFDKLMGFAAYGFPKAHAASFAVLAYQSAWLKYYYPTEFLCSLFNNQPMGFYPPHVLVNDAKRHGVRITGPDINRSDVRCTTEDNAVRFGFNYVAGIGEDVARQIVSERAIRGNYRSLADFVRRIPLRLQSTESLIRAGAFDCFGLGRREALWQLGLFIAPRQIGRGTDDHPAGKQLGLALPIAQDLITLRPASSWEQMTAAYDALGLSPLYHPLRLMRPHLQRQLVTSNDLFRMETNAKVQFAGLVVCRQRPATAQGITFLLLEDELGFVNIVVYVRLYEAKRRLVRAEPLLVVTGRLERDGPDGNVINLIAHDLAPIEAALRGPAPLPALPCDPVRSEITVATDDVAASAHDNQAPARSWLSLVSHDFH